MPANVVIDRSHHGPRVLGIFSALADAEAYRERLLEDEPAWERILFIRYYADDSARPAPNPT